MKVIYNKYIPFKGFKCLNLFGVIFVREEDWDDTTVSQTDLNHEAIHTAQMRELLYVPFYLAYFFEWLYRLADNWKTAYKSISFEKEAYGNQDNPAYLLTRKHWAQWRK